MSMLWSPPSRPPAPVRSFSLGLGLCLLFLLARAPAAPPDVAPEPATASSGIDIVVLCDKSGSMKTSDPALWRVKALQMVAAYASAADRFLGIAFDGKAYELTRGFVTQGALAAVQPAALEASLAAGGQTDFVQPFSLALRQLEGRSGAAAERPAIILFITDGEASPPSEAELDAFRQRRWSVHGFALGEAAALDTVSRICERTAGTARRTSDAGEIQRFFLAVYGGVTQESSAAYQEGAAGTDQLLFTPTLDLLDGLRLRDLTFTSLEEGTALAGITELRVGGEVVWSLEAGPRRPGLLVERRQARWRLPAPGSFCVLRVQSPGDARYEAVLQGAALGAGARRVLSVTYHGSIHLAPLAVQAAPDEAVAAVVLFRDEEGALVEDEGLFARIEAVEAELRSLGEDKVLETIALVRQAAGAPDLLRTRERALAFWGHFQARPPVGRPYVISYRVTYKDRSVQALAGPVVIQPAVALRAEPERLRVLVDGDSAIAEAEVGLRLAGTLPAGSRTITLEGHQATDLLLVEPPHTRVAAGAATTFEATPRVVTARAPGDLVARLRVRVPIPASFQGGVAAFDVEARARSPGLEVAPARIQVEVERRILLDLSVRAAAGEVAPPAGQASTLLASAGDTVEVVARPRAGARARAPSVRVRVACPASQGEEVALASAPDGSYRASMLLEASGLYEVSLVEPPDGAWSAGKASVRIEARPRAARVELDPSEPTWGQPTRVRVTLAGPLGPAAALLPRLHATMTGPDSEVQVIELSPDASVAGSYCAAVIPGGVGVHEVSLLPDSAGRFTMPSEPSRLRVKPLEATLEVAPTRRGHYWGLARIEARARLRPAAAVPPAIPLLAARLRPEGANAAASAEVLLERISEGTFASREPLPLAGASRWSLELLPGPGGAWESPPPVQLVTGQVALEVSSDEVSVGEPVRVAACFQPPPPPGEAPRMDLVVADGAGLERQRIALPPPRDARATLEVPFDADGDVILGLAPAGEAALPDTARRLGIRAPQLRVEAIEAPAGTATLAPREALRLLLRLTPSRDVFTTLRSELRLEGDLADFAITCDGAPVGPEGALPVALEPGARLLTAALEASPVTPLPWLGARRLSLVAPDGAVIAALSARGPTPAAAYVALGGIVLAALWASWWLGVRPRWTREVLLQVGEGGEVTAIPLRHAARGRHTYAPFQGAVLVITGTRWSPEYALRRAGAALPGREVVLDGEVLADEPIAVTDGARLTLREAFEGEAGADDAASADDPSTLGAFSGAPLSLESAPPPMAFIFRTASLPNDACSTSSCELGAPMEEEPQAAARGDAPGLPAASLSDDADGGF